MHYRDTDFAYKGLRVMKSKIGQKLGGGPWMSVDDKEKINNLYECWYKRRISALTWHFRRDCMEELQLPASNAKSKKLRKLF